MERKVGRRPTSAAAAVANTPIMFRKNAVLPVATAKLLVSENMRGIRRIRNRFKILFTTGFKYDY